jgi:hypothetical protein
VGIFSEEELRDRDEGGAEGGSGLSTVEEEKGEEACAPLASPSITSTASSTSPLLQTEGGKVSNEKLSTKKQQRRDEATVDSREDLDEFDDEVLEGYSEHPSEVEDLRDEVLTFPTNCPDCNAPASTNMKVTSKFHFYLRPLLLVFSKFLFKAIEGKS